jgi:hypothetical protein
LIQSLPHFKTPINQTILAHFIEPMDGIFQVGFSMFSYLSNEELLGSVNL